MNAAPGCRFFNSNAAGNVHRMSPKAPGRTNKTGRRQVRSHSGNTVPKRNQIRLSRALISSTLRKAQSHGDSVPDAVPDVPHKTVQLWPSLDHDLWFALPKNVLAMRRATINGRING